jgi:hypothetical protein
MLSGGSTFRTLFTFNPDMNFPRVLLFILVLSSCIVTAQNRPVKPDQAHLVQFSGVVLDQDSLTPLPYVSILVKGTKRGVITDFYGFFSMVINPGDELEFYSLTHKPRTYKLPDTVKTKYYYAIQVLAKDTLQLPVVDVYPWPSKEDFKKAFLALDLNDTDAERADKNLQREALSYLERNQTASATENYRYVMQAYYTKVYTSGQQPSINLLNPLKWAEFIDAWRKGKFKNANTHTIKKQ